MTLDRPSIDLGFAIRPKRAGSKDVSSQSATIEARSAAAVAQDVDSREALIDYVSRRLNSLVIKGSSPLAALNTFLALRAFIGNDAATPQVGSDGEGGVETEWLVDGHSLILSCGADGENLLWALDPSCELKFSVPFNPRMVDIETLERARKCIEAMNPQVKNRAPRS